MRLIVPQNAPEVQALPMLVSECECESFAVPISFGVRRELPASPGRYLILLRQRHSARLNRPWKWGRFVGEM